MSKKKSRSRMSPNKKTGKFSQKRLRDIMWKTGGACDIPAWSDHVALLMIHPHFGHVCWNITEESVRKIKKQLGRKTDRASLVVRVYDVTDIIFDGFNAHSFFDIDAGDYSGNHYFGFGQSARNLMAEAGLRCRDGAFHALARSNIAFFERDRVSGNYRTEGLFVRGVINRVFSVENIFDAPVYERMNRELASVKRERSLSVAKVLLDINNDENYAGRLDSFIRNMSTKLKKFSVRVSFFSTSLDNKDEKSGRTLIKHIQTASGTLYKKLSAAHKKKPFHIVHCHDWYSSVAGMNASAGLDIPMVLTLHSTEYERSSGNVTGRISSEICSMEKAAVEHASLVIVPYSSTRTQVINLYNADPEKVVIIPHVFDEKPSDESPGPSDARRWFGLNQTAPVVLFAGEMSHASGADILVEALPTACRNNGSAQFVFAGEGPLKGELEARVHHAGIGHRCRFVGDMASKSFNALLLASDFVVIPARTWQDEGLAHMAISCGKPVLTTQQAGISCVRHGENGLVTFDNPGSITWGIQEMLSNPLGGSMMRIVARKNADESLSLETIAAQHYMYYEILLKNNGVSGNV